MANAAPGVGDSAVAEAIRKTIEGERLSVAYTSAPYGQTREMGRMMAAFVLAIGLSFIFMYLVLAAQFESWLHPITILVSLPLTLPFAFLSVILFRQAIDLYSILGILVLRCGEENPILQMGRPTSCAKRDVASGCDPSRQPRSVAPDLDDHVRFRRRNDSTRRCLEAWAQDSIEPPPASSSGARCSRSF